MHYIELFSFLYRKFSCHVCPSKFRHSSNLQKHIKTQHGDAELEKVKKYGKKGSNKCHFCDYRSNFEENLKRHILRVHKNDTIEKVVVYPCADNMESTEIKPDPEVEGEYKKSSQILHHISKTHACSNS